MIMVKMAFGFQRPRQPIFSVITMSMNIYALTSNSDDETIVLCSLDSALETASSQKIVFIIGNSKMGYR